MHHGFREHIRAFRARGAAVPAFTAYDLATATGVVTAAERAGVPVILLVSPSTAATRYGHGLVRSLRALADASPAPVAVQLDHATDLALIRATVEAGAHAVLADGSREGYQANLDFVRAVRRHLDDDVIVEAELGRIDGNEDVALSADGHGAALTDPDEAARFADATGVDLLAVSVGNVHGFYRGVPALDLDRLAKIAAATDVPLVLHGASGLPSDVITAAIDTGVCKINVNTELRRAVFAHLEEATPAHAVGLDLDSLLAGWVEATAVTAAETIASFRGDHRPATDSGAAPIHRS
ncbi:class II fructose-bisphosphate aldolase [Streptomyces sp. SCSIO 75703]|uniref:class II fructose-bisphosphate aldolase n=1 Tax=unclassified Streptomyces TaxID=2593676 RepID=UPI0006913AFF|nr:MULTISPECIES: class II fructose-bisphosphate aldolase [unclassified Streptomyces]